MNPKAKVPCAIFRYVLVILCTVVIVPGDTLAYAAFVRVESPSGGEEAAKIPPDQLDSLVAPIALYPDPMLAQTLAASTYPLELIQLQQWLAKNSGLKDQALLDAVMKEPWDPSIQALAGLPDVVKRLADDIQWTTDLGNAFLAQQSDVMDAVQRMRKKAQDTGNLKSTEQQKVETQVIENKSVIVVEQANPQVVYVPSYDPVVVYGPPVYPYPPIYYPPAGYYAAGIAISFGIGVAMGAFWGGGWGWGAGWGGNNNININNNNNFNRNSNINGGNRNNFGGGNRPSNLPARGGGDPGAGAGWKHNPQHRGGAPYGDRGTADRFGGTARGDSLSNRQSNARQQVGRQGGNLASNRPGDAGVSNRMGGGAGSNRAGGPGISNRASGGGADRVGNRDASRGGGGNRDAFGGGSGGYNGSNARGNSNRGSSSMGSRGGGGGGGARGGGGRGGGRCGGGRRR
jgi:hypothetical protein